MSQRKRRTEADSHPPDTHCCYCLKRVKDTETEVQIGVYSPVVDGIRDKIKIGCAHWECFNAAFRAREQIVGDLPENGGKVPALGRSLQLKSADRKLLTPSTQIHRKGSR